MSDARPEHRPVPGRALLALGGAFGVAALALGVFAIRSADDGDGVVLDATPASSDVTPVTVPVMPPTAPTPPAPATPVTGGDTAAASTDSGTTDSGTTGTTEPAIELSPLADLLGVPGSAIPPAIEPRVRPRSVTIDDLELWGPVRAVGLEEDGQLEVPDETEIGWYRYGSSPGRAGATVLAAHVFWNRTVGPFHQLANLDPGARVDVRLDDDTLRTYEVVERAIYDKDSLPRERIWRTTGDETLVLITCGGSFNPEISRYRQNIVVYAVPVASEGQITN